MSKLGHIAICLCSFAVVAALQMPSASAKPNSGSQTTPPPPSSGGSSQIPELTPAEGFVFEDLDGDGSIDIGGIDALDVGMSFNVNFNGSVEKTNVNGLSSTAVFTFKGFDLNSTKALFDITLDNTSTNPITSRTSALGFNVSSDLTNASVTPTIGSSFTNAHLNDGLPNGFGDLDVCFNNNSNNCKGGKGEGNGGGVSTADTPGKFSVALNFNKSVSSFALTNFGIRYQSIYGTSLGTSGTGKGTATKPPKKPPTREVPEPTAISAILLAGFGMLSKSRKRQQEENQAAV